MSDPYWYEKEIEALRTELEQLRASVIEECARVADSYEEAEFGYNPTAVKIANAIRALKEP